MKRRAAGSVTLFYAGIFLSFAGLFGALLESVRVQTTRGMATDSAYLAIQNVLTEYQRELWEDYHLLFYDQDELGGEAGIEERLNRNMAVSWNPVSAGSALPVFSENDWLRVRCSCDGTAAISGMTERQGLAVGEQITAYMKYQTATETVKFLLEQTGLLRGLTDGKKVISEKLKLEESFSGLEKKKNTALKQLENMKQIWDNSEATAAVMTEKWNQAQEAVRIAAEEARKKAEEAAAQPVGGQASGAGQQETAPPKAEVSAEVNAIYRAVLALKKQNAEMRAHCQGYRVLYEEACGRLTEYENGLEENREEIAPETWEALKSDVRELRSFQLEEGMQYMSELEGKLCRNEQTLDRILELCRQEDVPVPALTGMMSTYQSALLPEQYQLPGQGQGEDPFAKLKAFASKGVLALVLPGNPDLSQSRLSPAVWQESEYQNAGSEGSGQAADMMERMMAVWYGQQHFGNYTMPKKDTALRYEQEYLLIGSEGDTENLAGAASELLTLRTVADFMQIITKPEKVAKARNLAMAAAGAAGASALVPVIKTGILILWSFEDALAEVRDLYQGKRVPFYQDISPFALDYEGYLTMLTLMGSGDRQRLRMIRMIEGNMQKRYKADFQAERLASGLRTTVNVRIAPGFTGKAGRHIWEYREEYQLDYQ